MERRGNRSEPGFQAVASPAEIEYSSAALAVSAPSPYPFGMSIVVTEFDTAAIQFAAAIEVRRLFPEITDNAVARQ